MKKANSTFPSSATNGLSPLLVTSRPCQLLEVNSLDTPFAHWGNGSLCPLLQHTDQHSAGWLGFRLRLKAEGLQTRDQGVICLHVPTLPMKGKNSIYQVDPYKGAHKSRHIKLLCYKRNQDLVK